MAQNQFLDTKRLVVHSEVAVPAVHVPEITRIKSLLDYFTCCAVGAISMSKYLKY